MLSRHTRLRVSRRGVARRTKLEIAFSANTAFREEDTLADLFNINFAAGRQVVRYGSDRKFQDEIASVVTIAEPATAILAVLRRKFLFKAKLLERGEIGDTVSIDVAAFAS